MQASLENNNNLQWG